MLRTKRWIALAMMVTLSLAGTAVSARAAMPGDARHRNIGVGFHDITAPVGVRWWLSDQKVGIDAGLGFHSDPASVDPDERVMGWAIDLGVPFVISSWERAHVNVRPGLMYQSQEEGFIVAPGDFETESAKLLSLSLELEAEVFLVDAVSVSVGHGLSFDRFTPADDPTTAADESDDDSSSFGTFGRSFGSGTFSNEFTVGFHVYFLGGGR